MSILFCIREQFLPIVGSYSFRINRLLKRLEDSEKMFLVPRNQDKKIVEKTYNSLTFQTFTPIPRFSYWYKSLVIFPFVLECSTIMKKISNMNDVKVIYGFGFTVALNSRMSTSNTPLVLDICEADLPYARLSNQSSISGFLAAHAENFIFSSIEDKEGEIFVLNQAMKDYFKKRGITSKKIRVAYDGTDPSIFKPKSFDEKRKNPCIIFTGDLDSRDGVDILIKSFVRVKREFKDVRLYIIGDGPFLPRLKNLASKLNLSNNIIFTGWIPFEKLMKDLPNFLVGVVPSKYHLMNDIAIPRKTFEFMAAGVPVVASDLNAMREVIQNNQSGLFFNTDDHESLSEAIIRLISDPSMYNRIQKNGREISEKHGVDKEVAKIERSIRKYAS
jgi:glycosyltransferase involved in cell wall biosynthesis